MKLMMKAALIAIPVALATSASAETFVRMASGPSGGSWYPIGAKIMDVMQKNVPGISARNGPGGGVGNVRTVNKGNAEMGWTFGFTAYDGWVGRDAFKKDKEQKNIRFFATLFPGVLQTVVPAKSKLRSYGDLAKSNISPGKRVFSGNVTTRRLLPLYGINYDSIKKNGGTIHRVGYTDSVALMKDGHIDAFVGLTSVPNSSFIALDFSPGVRFIPVEDNIADKFIKQNPGFRKATIPAGAYKNLKTDVQTLATATVLITNKNVSDELVYKLTAAFWNQHSEILKAHSAWKHVQIKSALAAATVPIHPGAKKFYDQKGVMK